MTWRPERAGNAMAGVGFALGYDPATSVRDMAQSVAAAEEAGYTMGFFSETIFTNRDSVSAVSVFSLGTRTMVLGTIQVVRLRSPLVMAQTAATLDELSDGRFVLVVGACTDKHAARNGLRPQAPPQTLREYVETIRMLWTGEPVTYDGEFIHMDKVALNWMPRRHDIPIWIAGASRIGLTIAGQIGDGVLLDAGTSPEYSANALPIIRAARQAAGLPMEGFTVAQLVNTSIEKTRGEALAAVRWEVASKFRHSSTAQAKLRVGEPNISAAAPVEFSTIYRERGLDALLAAIPDSYVQALTASGDLEEVVARVQRYRDAGVHLPLLRPAAPAQIPRLLAGATALRGS